MKCVDCKKPFTRYSEGRKDICRDCWHLRGETIRMVQSGEIPISTFREIQMAIGAGFGQKAMLEATRSDLYVI